MLADRARSLCRAYEAVHGHLEGDTLRVIVDCALELDPNATVEDVHAAVVEATEEHEANRRWDALTDAERRKVAP